MAKILTIDLGTTFFKTALFDREGRLCDSCRLAPPIHVPQPGWMELPVQAFIETIARGIAELGNRAGDHFQDITAVTFATQTNSFVLLDSDNRPLTPIILWPDGRAAELEADIGRRCDLPAFTATTGIPKINSQFMVGKLFWIQQHMPEIWNHTVKLCLLSDYLTLLFTGNHVTEAGAAGLTGLVDIHKCQWWPEMLAQFEMDERCLPTIVRAGTDLGPITSQAAEQFGLPGKCHFVAGCLDQYAGAIGAGNVEPEIVSETTGTVLATVRCSRHVSSPLGSDVFQGPGFREGTYWRMAFGNTSANLLQWYQNQLPSHWGFEELTALADSVEPGAEGLRLDADFDPNRFDRVFKGLTAQHTRGHAVRCIMEAVAQALKQQVAVLSDDAKLSEIRCAGGAARSDTWLQIKADMLGIATMATCCSEPTSLGAAILAEGAITAEDIGRIARHWTRLKQPHHPNAVRHLHYQMLFP